MVKQVGINVELRSRCKCVCTVYLQEKIFRMHVFVRKISRTADKGFTLVEIILVVTIIGIISLLAIPMLSSAGDFQLRAAANIIASDLEYAKSLAISQQENFSIVFNASTETYVMKDSDGAVVADPVRAGSTISVDFANDGRFDQVNISSVNFDSTDTVTFDYLGCPYNGSDTALSSGSVVLNGRQFYDDDNS